MTREAGIRLRQARQARVRAIRRRVLGGAVELFAVVWALIAVILVTGHDPALARRAAATPTGAAATPTGAAATPTGAAATPTGSGAVAPMTSRQS